MKYFNIFGKITHSGNSLLTLKRKNATHRHSKKIIILEKMHEIDEGPPFFKLAQAGALFAQDPNTWPLLIDGRYSEVSLCY